MSLGRNKCTRYLSLIFRLFKINFFILGLHFLWLTEKFRANILHTHTHTLALTYIIIIIYLLDGSMQKICWHLRQMANTFARKWCRWNGEGNDRIRERNGGQKPNKKRKLQSVDWHENWTEVLPMEKSISERKLMRIFRMAFQQTVSCPCPISNGQ